MLSNIKHKIKIGDPVRVEKIQVINQSVNSISDNYWTEGFLAGSIKEGYIVSLLRYRNSDKPDDYKNLGIFTSSPIVSVDFQPDCLIVKTQNSVYSVQKLLDAPVSI